MNQQELKLHVTILGWLDVVSSLLFVAAGSMIFLLFAGIGKAANDPEALPILAVIGTVLGGFLFLVSLPSLLAGYGLLTGRSWGRMLAIVVAVLLLFAVPVGTVIGAYALWVLGSEEATRYFEGTRRSALPRPDRAR